MMNVAQSRVEYELLDLAQLSRLGVDMGDSFVLSAAGQADDTALLSNDIQKLKHILQLCTSYCQKYNVQLSHSKTKLMKISPNKDSVFVPYNPLTINGESIKFVSEAEHVGVVRSTSGSMPNIITRVAAFKKAMGAIVSCGLAKGRRSNPAVSLRIMIIYGTPVLMSGLSSLVLSIKEVSCIDQQHKRTLQNIIKLSTNSPSSLVHFVAGSLPGSAILHLRQLSLFGMVCRLPTDPLHHHAVHVLLTSSSPTSWFSQVRGLLQQYKLPHPLLLLHNPPAKEAFKNLVKSKVLDYWETKLRSEAEFLPSLSYFHPQFMSLSTPHRIWSTAGSNSYEVSKAKVQLMFLASQYPCAKLTRHWSTENPQGICSFQQCQDYGSIESPEHILLHCPAYSQTRQRIISLCLNMREQVSQQLVTLLLLSNSSQKIMQFLLDCSAIPEVIHAAQIHGEQIYRDLFYLSRTWCFALHRERMKRLCKWPIFSSQGSSGANVSFSFQQPPTASTAGSSSRKPASKNSAKKAKPDASTESVQIDYLTTELNFTHTKIVSQDNTIRDLEHKVKILEEKLRISEEKINSDLHSKYFGVHGFQTSPTGHCHFPPSIPHCCQLSSPIAQSGCSGHHQTFQPYHPHPSCVSKADFDQL